VQAERVEWWAQAIAVTRPSRVDELYWLGRVTLDGNGPSLVYDRYSTGCSGESSTSPRIPASSTHRGPAATPIVLRPYLGPAGRQRDRQPVGRRAASRIRR